MTDARADERRRSRRSFLKGMLAASAVAAIPGGLLFGCDASRERADDDDLGGERPRETRTLHFNLAHSRADAPHTLVIGSREIELTPHTDASRAEHRGLNSFLRGVPDEHLTHYAPELDLPADAVQSYQIRTPNPDHPLPAMALAGIHIPHSGLDTAVDIKGGSLRLHPRRSERYGTAGAALKADGAAVQNTKDVQDFVDPYDAARFCVFHHSELMSLDPPTAAIVMSHIDSLPSMDYLYDAIADLGPASGPEDDLQGWTYGQWSLDFDGNQIPMLDFEGNPILDDAGDPRMAFDYIQDPSVKAAMGPVVAAALLLVKNDADLENEKYIVNQGVHAQDEDAPAPLDATTAALSAFSAQTGYTHQMSGGNSWRHGQRVKLKSIENRTATFEVDNSFLRHLDVWATFEDANGETLTLDAVGVDQDTLDTEHMVHLGLLGPPPRILGLPVIGMTHTSGTYDVTMPEQASRISIVTGALAFMDGDDWRAEYAGATTWATAMTLVFELGFPTIMLASGVAGRAAEKTSTKVAYALTPIVFKVVTNQVATKLLSIKGSGLSGVALTLANVVLKKSIAVVGSIIMAEISEAAAEELAEATMPIIGWVMFVIDLAVTAAEILTTDVDVALSRSALRATLSFTHDIRVKVLPDVNDAEGMPSTATEYKITALFDNGATSRFIHKELTSTSVAEIDGTFSDVPTGGKVKIMVQLRSDSGWVAGTGLTGSGIGATTAAAWTDNVSENGAGLDLTVQIRENMVPLSGDTVYSHARKLTMDGAGSRAWEDSAEAPGATLADADCGADGVAGLCQPMSITFNDRVGRVGYGWQALSPGLAACGSGAADTQLFQAQSLNIAAALQDGAPDAARQVVDCGLEQPVHLLYSQLGDADGQHFVLAPAGGVYHARKVSLAADGDPDIAGALKTGSSWGRFFSQKISSAALHPSGYLAVLNGDHDKIEILRLRDAADDANARPANLMSGRGSRRGNINGGKAVAATHDGGTFLVLEDQPNLRIQAMDEHCNPVNYFAPEGTDAPMWFVPLKDEAGATVTYLDMSVAASGFIYVLSYTGTGADVGDYRLDLYGRHGAWMARTEGVAAARMVVDHWENVYALNWEMLVSADGRAEPSVSKWIPSTP